MRKMNKKGLLGMFAAGAVAVGGAVYSLREKPLEDGWKECELYVESPNYPAFVQKILDKIPVGIDGQTIEHPEDGRVYCTDWHFPNEETMHHSCYTQLASIEDEERGLNAELSEELISPDKYKFSSLDITDFKKNPKRLREIINNIPWILEGAINGGYIVENIRNKDGKITERYYELKNGKKIIAIDSNKNGILDRYKEIK